VDERRTETEPVGAMSTVAEPPPWERAGRARPTWGLDEGDAIASGRTVLRRIGGGRRYEVFLVWDEHRLSVLVAKVLRPDQAAEPLALSELKREAEMLARLGHPVVVRGFDFAAGGPFPHLLLEHLEGPTLQLLLERHGPLGLEQLLPLGLHTASALHYIAREGLVHLDVKPENLVMGAPPRLIDFSVARSLDAAARIARPIGTDAYMAPEQCGAGGEGVAPIGPAADVFGLGATLQYAMTGARAFPRTPDARNASDPEVRFPQLTRGPAPLPKRTPPALAELLAAMLAFDPTERPSAADVAHALEPVVSELPRRLVLRGRWRRRR
jgi:eukaryotic-like serine/threonine-protein kinase